jgi:hypothetical protein
MSMRFVKAVLLALAAWTTGALRMRRKRRLQRLPRRGKTTGTWRLLWSIPAERWCTTKKWITLSWEARTWRLRKLARQRSSSARAKHSRTWWPVEELVFEFFGCPGPCPSKVESRSSWKGRSLERSAFPGILATMMACVRKLGRLRSSEGGRSACQRPITRDRRPFWTSPNRR